MNRHFLFATLFAATALLTVPAWAGSPVTDGEIPKTVATTPSGRTGAGWWMGRVKAQEASAKRRHDIVFVGDSITHFWDNRAPDIMKECFGDVLNLGISGDHTEQVLWRIARIDWKTVSPKKIMVMIGTNNAGHRPSQTPEEIYQGIRAILRSLRTSCPQADIVLLPIFPRGADGSDPIRKITDAVNAKLAPLADDPKIVIKDLAPLFLKPDGTTLDQKVMPDRLHPVKEGYRRWALAVKPLLCPQETSPVFAGDIRTCRATKAVGKTNTPWWMKRLHMQEAAAKRAHDIVWVGDSITHIWDDRAPDVMKQFGDVLNLGTSADRTEHVLWRIRRIDWKTVNPKRIMLMIGTNNSGQRTGDTPEDIFEGTRAILRHLRTECPKAEILLLKIFPRGADGNDAARKNNDAVNALLSQFTADPMIRVKDLAPLYLQPKSQKLNTKLMPDRLHPNKAGLIKWADAVRPILCP